MRRKAIRVGWGLVALGMVMLAVVVTVGAFRAHNDEAFNRWVGWATIWALVVGAIGVLLVVWDKIFPMTTARSAPPRLRVGWPRSCWPKPWTCGPA
jgi:hypothetical protein